MKPVTLILLVGSLGLNVWFASGLLHASSSDSAAPSAVPVAAAPAKAERPAALAIDPAAWTNLKTTDLAQLNTRLRDAGFPPALIRALLQAQIQEDAEARMKALDPEAANRPFWKNSQPNAKLTAELRKQSSEAYKQLRKLVGEDDAETEPFAVYYRERQYAGLPADKAASIRRISSDFDDRMNDLAQNSLEFNQPADRAKLQALQKERHDAIAQALTPEELTTYDLHNSSTAQNLQYQLRSFDITESEFLNLYQIRKALDDKFPPPSISGIPSPSDMEARRTAQQDYDAQVKALFGEQRYAEFQRASDYTYQQATRLVARLELPPESAVTVYNVQKDIQQRANAVRNDHNLNEADRAAQLAALSTEATTKISTALGGARGFEAYKLNGGNWLQTINRLPVRPPTN